MSHTRDSETWCPACERNGCRDGDFLSVACARHRTHAIGALPSTEPPAEPCVAFEVFVWSFDGQWFASNRHRSVASAQPMGWRPGKHTMQNINADGHVVVSSLSLRQAIGALGQIVVQQKALSAIAEKHLNKKETPTT